MTIQCRLKPSKQRKPNMTIIAGMGLGLAAGYTMPEAMHLANTAAGVVVAKLGTAVCSFAELVEALDGQ